MQPKASEIATGRWKGILPALGVDEAFLTGKHGPCPMCGGRDRWRFDDKAGRGTWICNNCGAGDGFKLLEVMHGWNFSHAAKEVERVAGVVVPQQIAQKQQGTALARRTWDESMPVTKGDPVALYIAHRVGLDAAPACLRYHPSLIYVDDDGEVSYHPGMVAAVLSQDGTGATVHRTYLTKTGTKASVASAKKLMPGNDLKGAAIRLAPATETLGVAEGIETALAASRRFMVPVWACISSSIMTSFVPPSGVRNLIVFGDNDAGFAGQAAAYHLAQRMYAKGYRVEVRIPEIVGKDWADEP